MYTESQLDNTSKATFYKQLAQQAQHLLDGEPNWIANLSNVSALLNLHLADTNWVGFYLWDEGANELVLGPFQGKPACIRIASGRGVCGTAFAERKATVVEDVFQFPGHIACDPASRSEVVIPLVHNGQAFGVLDIDAPLPGRFDEADANGLQTIVDVIVRYAGFPSGLSSRET